MKKSNYSEAWQIILPFYLAKFYARQSAPLDELASDAEVLRDLATQVGGADLAADVSEIYEQVAKFLLSAHPALPPN